MYSWVEDNIAKIDMLSKLVYRVHEIPIKTPAGFFCCFAEIAKLTLNKETKRSQKSQNNLENEHN